VGECLFWYRPTRVVPDQRPLNGRCCCCCCPFPSATLSFHSHPPRLCSYFTFPILGILNRQSRAERQNRTKLTVKLQIISTEHDCRINSYWQNITCTGRIRLILTEHDLYWHNLTSIGRISLLPEEYDCSEWVREERSIAAALLQRQHNVMTSLAASSSQSTPCS